MQALIVLFLSAEFILPGSSFILADQASASQCSETIAYFPDATAAQDTSTVDVIIFKSGRTITGTIVESIPGQGVRIRTPDGVIHSYKWSVVSKVKLGEQVAEPVKPPTGAAQEVTQVSSQERASPGARPKKESSFEGSILLGGSFNSAEIYPGLGLRIAYRIPPAFYVGIGCANHLAKGEFIGYGYIGGELGYEVRLPSLTAQPYVSGGLLYGPGVTTAYIAPAIAVRLWLTPKIGVGADVKYAYAPSYSAGIGFMYVGVVLKF